jgi:hypothetical protein
MKKRYRVALTVRNNEPAFFGVYACGATAMQSSLKSPRRSSKPQQENKP